MIAYDRDMDKSFYGWLAGVLPKYRNYGVLTELSKYLVTYSKNKGYSKIKVKTRNNLRDILSFYVKVGFNFTAVEKMDNINDNRIYLEKQLI